MVVVVDGPRLARVIVEFLTGQSFPSIRPACSTPRTGRSRGGGERVIDFEPVDRRTEIRLRPNFEIIYDDYGIASRLG